MIIIIIVIISMPLIINLIVINLIIICLMINAQGALETVWGGEVAVACSAPGGLPQVFISSSSSSSSLQRDDICGSGECCAHSWEGDGQGRPWARHQGSGDQLRQSHVDQDDDGDPIAKASWQQVSYYPTLRETGAVFVCRWQQLAKVRSSSFS